MPVPELKPDNIYKITFIDPSTGESRIMAEDQIAYQEITFGFLFGSAEVTRLCSDKKKRWVILQIKTPKQMIQVYVTKTGKIRIYDADNCEWFKLSK